MRHGKMATLIIVLMGLGVTVSVTGRARGDGQKPPRIEISVTEKGFEPEKITVKKGQPLRLVFTRKTEKTCAKEVVVRVSDEQKIEQKLPLDTPVEIPVTFPKSGELAYGCGMNMITGVITVQ
jgi:plastocyanin domain-containing protein